jgi:acetyl esterase
MYKTVGDRKLAIHLHYPSGWKAGDRRPAIVFFFGGGWTGGSVKQFLPQAEYFASRGMVAARVDYRVKSRDGVTPDVCVEDARSAVRWLRANAGRLGIDPAKLVASGGSAGGHLAACTMIAESVEADGDDLSVSTVPRAMVLFNPVLSFEHEEIIKRLGDRQILARKISPTAHLDKQSPPALILFGTKDRLKAFGDAYWEKADALGVRAEKFIAEGQGHGFFNRSPWCEKTLIAVDEFLVSLGLLEGPHTVQVPPAGKGDAAAARRAKTPRTRESMLKRWRAMDIDGDGRLSRTETQGAMLRNFDRIDTNSDNALDEQELEALAVRLAP